MSYTYSFQHKKETNFKLGQGYELHDRASARTVIFCLACSSLKSRPSTLRRLAKDIGLANTVTGQRKMSKIQEQSVDYNEYRVVHTEKVITMNTV